MKVHGLKLQCNDQVQKEKIQKLEIHLNRINFSVDQKPRDSSHRPDGSTVDAVRYPGIGLL